MRRRFLSAVSGLAIAALAAGVTTVSPAADAVVRTAATVSCGDQRAAAQQAVGSAQSGVESAKSGLDTATGKVKKAKKKRKAAKSSTARKKATNRLKKAKQAKRAAAGALTDAEGVLAGAQRTLAALNACTDPVPDPEPQPDPLTFDFSDSVGLGLVATPEPAQARASRTTQRAAAAGGGSNLVAVLPDGSTRDAVASGEVGVQSFSVTGNGDVLVRFDESSAAPLPVLEWDLLPGGPGPVACAIAVVDRDSGAPTCLGAADWKQGGQIQTFMQLDARQLIQYDATGVGWFVLSDGNDGTSIASYHDGAVSARYANDNIYLEARSGALVPLGDGSVLAAGQTKSNHQTWCRRITPTGGVERVLDGVVSCGARLPDGNVYMDHPNNGTARFLTADLTLDERKWTDATGDPHFLFAPDDPHQPTWNHPVPRLELGWFGRPLITSTGKAYFLQGIMNSKPLAQLYPTPGYVTTWDSLQLIVRSINGPATQPGTQFFEAVDDRLIAGSFDDQGKLHATAYDTTTDTELWHVTGLEEKLDIDEAYHIQPLGDSAVLVDGLRFSDNKVVLGKVDLVTGEAEVLSVVGASKWTQFQTFS